MSCSIVNVPMPPVIFYTDERPVLNSDGVITGGPKFYTYEETKQVRLYKPPPPPPPSPPLIAHNSNSPLPLLHTTMASITISPLYAQYDNKFNELGEQIKKVKQLEVDILDKIRAYTATNDDPDKLNKYYKRNDLADKRVQSRTLTNRLTQLYQLAHVQLEDEQRYLARFMQTKHEDLERRYEAIRQVCIDVDDRLVDMRKLDKVFPNLGLITLELNEEDKEAVNKELLTTFAKQFENPTDVSEANLTRMRTQLSEFASRGFAGKVAWLRTLKLPIPALIDDKLKDQLNFNVWFPEITKEHQLAQHKQWQEVLRKRNEKFDDALAAKTTEEETKIKAAEPVEAVESPPPPVVAENESTPPPL